MKNDAGLKREIEFEKKLLGLMKQYDKGLREIIALLDPAKPSTPRTTTPAPKTRRARVVKVYENPETGELIETKGGNHRGLRAWKDQYGADIVEGWVRR
jgi:hypothetical protein